MNDKLRIDGSTVGQVSEWLDQGRGIASWKSINLGNLDTSWLTPARTKEGEPMEKPNWQCANEPERIVEAAQDIEVQASKEVKRFHVAVRPSGNGLSTKVTDGGSRRIRAAVEKAGEGAFHTFDYMDYNNAVIWAQDKVVPLVDYKAEVTA